MLHALKQFLQSTMESSEQSAPISIELAAGTLLVQLSQADNQQSNQESAKIIYKLKKLFQLSDAEAESILQQAQTQAQQATDLFDFTRHVKELDYNKRIEFVSALWHVAYADGELDPHEEALIRQISDLIYLSHSDFLQAKMQAHSA